MLEPWWFEVSWTTPSVVTDEQPPVHRFQLSLAVDGDSFEAPVNARHGVSLMRYRGDPACREDLESLLARPLGDIRDRAADLVHRLPARPQSRSPYATSSGQWRRLRTYLWHSAGRDYLELWGRDATFYLERTGRTVRFTDGRGTVDPSTARRRLGSLRNPGETRLFIEALLKLGPEFAEFSEFAKQELRPSVLRPWRIAAR
jgi:hypothetical protein